MWGIGRSLDTPAVSRRAANAKRWQLRKIVFLGLTALLLAVPGSAQQPSHNAGAVTAASRKRIFVDAKPISSNQVIVKDGVSYVDVSLLAAALGASVQTSVGGVMIITSPKPTAPKPEDCEKTALEGQRFSEQFRSNVAGVADEIESLRAVVLKREKVDIGPRFDAIDRKLSLSTSHVQTDADMAVYYALAYANNSLAITYYKQTRGVPVEEAQKDQMNSMLCAMESKFALMKGVLLPGGSCSVFKRIEAQSAPK